MFQLVKLNSRRYAIYDTVSRVYYYGKKKDLEKRIKELEDKDFDKYMESFQK